MTRSEVSDLVAAGIREGLAAAGVEDDGTTELEAALDEIAWEAARLQKLAVERGGLDEDLRRAMESIVRQQALASEHARVLGLERGERVLRAVAMAALSTAVGLVL